MLLRLPHPPRFQLRVAHDEQAASQRRGDRLRGDRLSGPRRSREVKGESRRSPVPLRQSPLLEDEVLLPDERQRLADRVERRRREDHVVECPPRLDHLEQRPAEEEVAPGVGHLGNVTGKDGTTERWKDGKTERRKDGMTERRNDRTTE